MLPRRNFFRRLFRARRDPVFWVPLPLGGHDRQQVEGAFARLFSTTDGQTVINHLQALTFARAYGADVPDNHLRHAEGQRALVGVILRLIAAGRQA